LMDADSMPPEGVGVWEEKTPQTTTATTAGTSRLGYVGTQSEWKLVDPMTGETINRVSVLNEDGKQVIINGKPVYRVNDYWFVLNVKLEWTEAPEPPEQPASSLYGGRMGATSTPKSTTSSSSSRSVPDVDM